MTLGENSRIIEAVNRVLFLSTSYLVQKLLETVKISVEIKFACFKLWGKKNVDKKILK